MPIGEVCVRDILVSERSLPVQEAARLMRQHHAGTIVVIDSPSTPQIPVGIVTDRDIVISVVAMKLDPAVYTIGDLLTQQLVTAREDQGIFESIQQMRINGVRRMPVVDAKGALIGIVSVDDLIQLLAEEMSELGKLISREQTREVQQRQ